MNRTTPSYQRRVQNGFFTKYLSGTCILDIGYGGGDAQNMPIVDHAVGIDLDYPNYDGIHLPFPDASQDAIFSSHCYEHISDYRSALREWYRVLRIGGYIVTLVPHKFLYERKSTVPSYFNPEHKRFYTPAGLLREFEEALPVNGFRVRHLADNDEDFDYSTPARRHPEGSCEIEFVIQKIERPSHSDSFELTARQKAYVNSCTHLVVDAIVRVINGDISIDELRNLTSSMTYFPAYEIIRSAVLAGDRKSGFESVLKGIISSILGSVFVDSALYLDTYPDIREAIERGSLTSAVEHFVHNGYFEGRIYQPDPALLRLGK
ncbi:MAG TPA: methyltransferase domain-containing protein [Stellaceae bacterium]|jgi:predicted SAM-dependent methyltransferase|nr:methyltransferase domain-containing protein [Stellaceae bacterium]